MPSPTTTRSGKEIKNRKVISKRRANQGLITNKKRAATLGQAPKNKLRAKKLAAGLPVKSKLSDEKKARMAAGTTKFSKAKAPKASTATSGVKVVGSGPNKKLAAKKKANAGQITNKKRAAKLGQTPNNKLRAAKQKAASGGIKNKKRAVKLGQAPKNKLRNAKMKAMQGTSNNRLRSRKILGKKTKTRG